MYECPSLSDVTSSILAGNTYLNKAFFVDSSIVTLHSPDIEFNSSLNMDYKDDMVNKYLRGEQIFSSVLNGFGVIKINNITLGGYKANSGNLNNYYPKGLRNF
jgi:hypothetical protein